jgi:hypothetical protein
MICPMDNSVHVKQDDSFLWCGFGFFSFGHMVSPLLYALRRSWCWLQSPRRSFCTKRGLQG